MFISKGQIEYVNDVFMQQFYSNIQEFSLPDPINDDQNQQEKFLYKIKRWLRCFKKAKTKNIKHEVFPFLQKPIFREYSTENIQLITADFALFQGISIEGLINMKPDELKQKRFFNIREEDKIDQQAPGYTSMYQVKITHYDKNDNS